MVEVKNIVLAMHIDGKWYGKIALGQLSYWTVCGKLTVGKFSVLNSPHGKFTAPKFIHPQPHINFQSWLTFFE